jgi:DNA-binding transcriptional LysR family regulator
MEVRIKFETILASATCNFVAAGAGISLVTAFSAAEFSHLPYEIRPFQPKLRFPIFILTARNRATARLAEAFIENLKVSAKRDFKPHVEAMPYVIPTQAPKRSAGVVPGR